MVLVPVPPIFSSVPVLMKKTGAGGTASAVIQSNCIIRDRFPQSVIVNDRFATLTLIIGEAEIVPAQTTVP